MNEDANECWIGNTTPTPSDAVCPTGHYCTIGSQRPKPCPIGTYSNRAGNTEASDDNGEGCTSCPAGSFCQSSGMTSPTDYCEAGFYCEEAGGDMFATPCPAGNKCVPGSNFDGLTPCEAKFYQPNII